MFFIFKNKLYYTFLFDIIIRYNISEYIRNQYIYMSKIFYNSIYMNVYINK
jgi:hypothetical protein